MKSLLAKQIVLFGIVLGAIAVLVGGLFFVVRPSQESYRVSEIEETNVLTIGDSAPEISLTDHRGTRVSLYSFFGKTPVIINFWAAWCPFCLEELNDFEELAKEFKGELTILAVNRAESREKVGEYINRIQPSENFIFLVDPSDAVYLQYRGRVMPYSVFIDKSGNIQDVKLGPMNLEEMRLRANWLLVE